MTNIISWAADYDWFEPTPESERAAVENDTGRAAKIAEARALSKELGADNITLANWERVSGFSFPDDKAPDGWRRVHSWNGRPFFMPRRDSKEGKALHARITPITIPSMETFSNLFGGLQFVGGGDAIPRGVMVTMRGAVYRTFAGRLLIGVPKGVDRERITVPVGAAVPFSEIVAALETPATEIARVFP